MRGKTFMKHKKTLFSVCALLSAAVFAMSACGETAHTHTFSEEWSKNSTDHWHKATCEHTDEISGKQPHLFEEGKCVVCGYPDPDYSKPDTGDPGKDKPDTGDTDKEKPDTGDPGKDKPDTGDPGTDDPGTEDPGTDDPGTEDPGTDKPSADDPDKDNLTDDIFEGNFTAVTSENDIDRVEDFVDAATRKLGIGCGFAEGDISFRVIQGGSVLWSYKLSGLEEDLKSSKDLKCQINLREPNTGETDPINYIAEGDAAYEEYESVIYGYNFKDSGLSLAENAVYNLWGTFSIAPSLFGHDIRVSYRTEGEYTVLKLEVTLVNNVDYGMGYGGVLTENITVEYALLGNKIAGLNYNSQSQLMYDISQPPAAGEDATVRVLVGNYPIEIPDPVDVTEMEGQPTWLDFEVYPDESIFDKEVGPIESTTAQNMFGSLISITRTRASGGLEAVFANNNYHIKTSVDGKEECEMVLDLYNTEGIRIKRVKDGETVTTDGTKSVTEKGGKKTEGASLVEEFYDDFEDDYEDVLELLMTYASDVYTGRANYDANYFADEDYFIVTFTQKDANGTVVHETTYVFSMYTSSLLGAKDVEKEEDGSTREICILCGDHKVEM